MSALTSTPAESGAGPLAQNTGGVKPSPSYVPQALPGETVVHQEKHLLVTTQRLVIGSRSYDLPAVKGAQVRKLATSRWPVLALLTFGAVMGGWLFTVWPLMGLVVVAVVALCVLGLVASIRPNYVLRITTAEGETDALMSQDRAYIRRANEALGQVLGR
jgi:hypothetical protein